MRVKKYAVLIIFICFFSADAFSQFRIRLFADQSADVVIFTVTAGAYNIKVSSERTIGINPGESVILTGSNGRLVVKTRNETGFSCDSVELSMTGPGSMFSLRTNPGTSVKRIFNGSLICKYDLGSVFLINIADIDEYIAGVVKSEGGNGIYPEYFKTQAVIARTYAYKYQAKHLNDEYNLCDGIHCQVYNGITTDTTIINAVRETGGEVIADRDSVLIISAFHSNCGGETAASEDVWLTYQPYLIKVTDPYCTSSRNATWEKKIGLKEWINYLRKNGYQGQSDDPSIFSYSQKTRKTDYYAGSFNFPLNTIRTDFSLRSTFFSVTIDADSLILNGRGYGHGVGLCQEGAMVMAKKGIDYKSIIEFYYSGVEIMDVKAVKKTTED
jgi:stage II sporulation protein D